MKSSLSLGQRIRYAREEAGLSQTELGKVLKLSDKTVSSYEVDRAEPNLETLREIGRATSTPISYFVEDHVAPQDLLSMKLAKIEQELAEIKKMLEGS